MVKTKKYLLILIQNCEERINCFTRKYQQIKISKIILLLLKYDNIINSNKKMVMHFGIIFWLCPYPGTRMVCLEVQFCSNWTVLQQISPKEKKWHLFLKWRKSFTKLGAAWESKTSSAGLGPLPCWSSWLLPSSSSWPRQSSRTFPTTGVALPQTKKPSGINLL